MDGRALRRPPYAGGGLGEADTGAELLLNTVVGQWTWRAPFQTKSQMAYPITQNGASRPSSSNASPAISKPKKTNPRPVATRPGPIPSRGLSRRARRCGLIAALLMMASFADDGFGQYATRGARPTVTLNPISQVYLDLPHAGLPCG